MGAVGAALVIGICLDTELVRAGSEAGIAAGSSWFSRSGSSAASGREKDANVSRSLTWLVHLMRFERGAFLAARSLASRAAVRFRTAASAAFYARADRSSGVMVSSERFPPINPPLRPISRAWPCGRSLAFCGHGIILRRIR
jgi:hypothetical protein